MDSTKADLDVEPESNLFALLEAVSAARDLADELELSSVAIDLDSACVKIKSRLGTPLFT